MNKWYLLNVKEYDFVTGKLPDGNQAVVGLLLPNLAVAVFDNDGNFLALREFPAEDEMQDIDTGITAIQTKLDLTQGAIKIKEFFLDGRYVGLKDMPDDYVTFLENLDSDEIDEDEREYYPEDIESWKENNLFLFAWAKDYWMDGNTGEINST